MGDTKSDAAAIRKELKAAGYNSRRVSVRTDYYSMGSSIYATIRDSGVDAVKVTEIVERIGEHISRCEITNDILGGGNTYTHVSYHEDVRAELSTRHEDAVQSAIDKLDAAKDVPGSRNYLYDVEGFSNVCVGLSPNGWAYSLWIDGTHGRDFDRAATGSLEIATSPKAAPCEPIEPAPIVEPAPAPVRPTNTTPLRFRLS